MLELSVSQWAALALIALGYYAMFRQLARWHRLDRRTAVHRADQDAELRAWAERREETRETFGRWA